MILWDLQTGGMLREVTAHEGWIRSVRFSPDGKQICSGGDDRLIRIWDASDLSEIRTHRLGADPLLHALWKPYHQWWP